MTTTCRRCSRPVKRGRVIGPACLKRERLAAMERAGEGYSKPIRDKAAALLSSGSVSPQPDGTCLVKSAEGRFWYQVNAFGCTCRAGELGRRCKHFLAVAMFGAVLRVGGLTGPFEGFKTSRKAAA